MPVPVNPKPDLTLIKEKLNAFVTIKHRERDQNNSEPLSTYNQLLDKFDVIKEKVNALTSFPPALTAHYQKAELLEAFSVLSNEQSSMKETFQEREKQLTFIISNLNNLLADCRVHSPQSSPSEERASLSTAAECEQEPLLLARREKAAARVTLELDGMTDEESGSDDGSNKSKSP
jgi:hypothetical protein